MMSEKERQPASPLGPVAARLETLWREILRLEEIGPDDTFIELGGESLAGTLCANRIEADFGVRIPLGILLAEDATLAALAAYIEASAECGGTPITSSRDVYEE